MKKLAALFVTTFLASLLYSGQIVHAVGKVTLSPSVSSINEGQSQVIGIQLDGPPGSQVTLTITSSNPETVNISPSTVTFATSEWAQTKNFTVSVPHNSFYGDTRNVLILARTSSASPNYDGIAGGATVHVTDMTSEPDFNDPQDPPPNEEEKPDPDNQQIDDISEPILTSTEELPTNQFPSYSSLSGTDSYEQAGSRLDVSHISADLQWVTDTFVPGRTSALRMVSGYSILTLLLGGIVAGFYIFKRKQWWRRQNSRDDRWYYRHLPVRSKTSSKKSSKTKKPTKKKIRKKRI